MAKNIENEYGVKVGDIFVCSWGYSMTIVSAYKVVSVTAKRCKVQEMNCEIVKGNGWSGEKAPIIGSEHGEVMNATCKPGYINAPHGYATKHENGKTYYFNSLD